MRDFIDNVLMKFVPGKTRRDRINSLISAKTNARIISREEFTRYTNPDITKRRSWSCPVQDDLSSKEVYYFLLECLLGHDHMTIFSSAYNELKKRTGETEALSCFVLFGNLQAGLESVDSRPVQRKIVAAGVHALLCFLISNGEREGYLEDDVQQCFDNQSKRIKGNGRYREQSRSEAITETDIFRPIQYSLDHNMPPILDRYIPRSKETLQLKEKLDHGHKQVFVWGQGGVGKTEFVISFANQVSNTYECFFTTFKDTIEETILGLNFDGWSAYEQAGGKNTTKPREQQYAEKLALLRRLNKNCLLIVDNADIHPEQLLIDPKWRDLERLDVRQLFTTRYEFDKANLLIEPFLKEQLYDYLHEYYISQFSFCKRNVLELIDAVERHTLTIDILGRLLKASKGCITPKDVLKALKENNANTDLLAVTSEYNRDYTKRSIYDHLQTVFNLAGLSANELYLMQCASVVSLDGMDAKFFADAIGSEYAELLDKLCEAGWVRRRDNQKVSLHPLIRSVIFYGNETQTTWSKIERFATSLLKKCQYTDVSFFFKENFCAFPAAAVYMCLSNITQLPDIPDSWVAEICETLAWELYFLNERITAKDSVAINFLSRCMLLNTALDCRENLLQASRTASPDSVAFVTKNLSALAGVWYKMGCLFANHFDHHEDACDAFCKAADILTECQEPNYFLIADCYGYAAYAYCQLEIFDQAMHFLKIAQSSFEKANKKCCEIYYPDRIPPTCFGFSYPEAKPKEIWGFFEANDEDWSFTYAVERIQNREPIPLLINGSYKIRVDPNR